MFAPVLPRKSSLRTRFRRADGKNQFMVKEGTPFARGKMVRPGTADQFVAPVDPPD
jgi:hypothetical protein